MPLKEFSCVEHGVFEKLVKMDYTGIVYCPVCGNEASKIVSGGSNFNLKGMGWHKDLYHGPSNNKGGK